MFRVTSHLGKTSNQQEFTVQTFSCLSATVLLSFIKQTIPYLFVLLEIAEPRERFLAELAMVGAAAGTTTQALAVVVIVVIMVVITVVVIMLLMVF